MSIYKEKGKETEADIMGFFDRPIFIPRFYFCKRLAESELNLANWNLEFQFSLELLAMDRD